MRPAFPAAAFVVDQVLGDGEKPGRELRARLVAGCRGPHPHEDPLGQVVGFVQIAQHTVDGPNHTGAVPLHEFFEGGNVAFLHSEHAGHVLWIGIFLWDVLKDARLLIPVFLSCCNLIRGLRVRLGRGWVLHSAGIGERARLARGQDEERLEFFNSCSRENVSLHERGDFRQIRPLCRPGNALEIAACHSRIVIAPLDFAFLQLGPGRFAVGEGPFEAVKRPPEDRSAFYCNDFALTGSHPWRVPKRFQILSSWKGGDHAKPEVRWESPAFERFAEAYDRVFAGFENGVRLEKLVPFVTERGRLVTGDLRALAPPLFENGRPHTWAYGWWGDTHGMLGVTPERFLWTERGQLETMALAGTAPRGHEAAFAADLKQVREHEYVVQGICQALGASAQCEQREILQLNGLLHFLTRVHAPGISVDRDQLDSLIERLHPTPAVGFLPKTPKVASLFREIRADLGPPEIFAAPFGCWHEGNFQSVITIRNVIWEGTNVSLTSGCGLIRESARESEWRELALKRDVVKTALGIG